MSGVVYSEQEIIMPEKKPTPKKPATTPAKPAPKKKPSKKK